VLQCVAVCCSVLQCVAVCCSVLQCVAVKLREYLLDRNDVENCRVLFYVLSNQNENGLVSCENVYQTIL